jgi:hypothetical protein
LTNLPVRINVGEASRPFHLLGSGLDRIEGMESAAGAITGKSGEKDWSGKISLKADAAEGQTFDLKLRVQGHEAPVEVPNAIQLIPPRPKIAAVRASVPSDLGVQIHDGELPSGATLGLSLKVENLRPGGGAPVVELGCASGDLRSALKLSPNSSDTGIIFISVDPGKVGYPGCELTASVNVESLGLSDPHPLGRVVRIPQLEEFDLTNEKAGDTNYVGVLKGRNLDVVDKVGWNAQTGVPVDTIPTPVPGDTKEETLRVSVPWPAPAPHAPIYVWLRNEKDGRATTVEY